VFVWGMAWKSFLEKHAENVNYVEVAFLFGLSYEEIIWKT
jgi:hypothetical protein